MDNGTAIVGRGKRQAAPPPKELALKAKEQQEKGEANVVDLNPKDWAPKIMSIAIEIESLTPLIVNNFDQKTRQQLMDSHMGKAKGQKKAPKDPNDLFERSKYKDSKGRDCLHAGGLRNSMISAARNIDGVTMTALKQGVFIEGPEGPDQVLLPIEYERCEMREDAVRNASGVADIRVRASYINWRAKFTLHVVQNCVSLVQAMQLLAMAGFACGLHEWRPAGKQGMGGNFGRFKIVTTK